MSKVLSAKSKWYVSPVSNEQLSKSNSSEAVRALLMISSEMSMPRTVPFLILLAKSIVIVPGPHPISRRMELSSRCCSRYFAEFSMVRQVCDLRTDSWWP